MQYLIIFLILAIVHIEAMPRKIDFKSKLSNQYNINLTQKRGKYSISKITEISKIIIIN